MDLWVKTLDSVWSECSDDVATQITELLTYTDIKWTMGQKVKSKVCMLHLTSDDRYFFHTGFVPKVLKHLRKKWKVVYTTEVPTLFHDEPHLDGIIFREYQKAFFPVAFAKGRGVLQAATGAGKSVIIGGIMSAFSQERILFLVHTQDLVTQMMKDLPEWGIKDIGEWTGNARKKARVMCATIQSFNKVVNDFIEYFDVVICDESVRGDQLIHTSVGPLSIEFIVEKKLPVQVLTWNEESKRKEWKGIKRYHKHPPKSAMIKITTNKGTLQVTKEHLCFTKNRGWIKAGDLSTNDILLDKDQFDFYYYIKVVKDYIKVVIDNIKQIKENKNGFFSFGNHFRRL